MNLRQYTVIATLGFLITLGFPSLRVDELLLRTNGELVIFPGAGISAWTDFTPIDATMLVKDVERKGQAVSFKLALDNELYLVSANCGPVTSVIPDPQRRADIDRVLQAAEWVCKTNAS